MKKRAKYYYDIADELFKEKDINKYAKINTISKKGVSISETTIFSSNKIKPVSVGQASRISGVSPADISVLLIYLEQLKREEK